MLIHFQAHRSHPKLAMLNTLINLSQVLLGFTLIIVIHELGHFLAARWAGVRVLAFAVGFGPALFSFRKGLGFTSGSSEARYVKILKDQPNLAASISPTEYRFNILPLGGYVKMLGQDDADPTATSDAADSYQRCAISKRMVIICAGVVANILLAAALFCTVFLIGLRSDPPIVGSLAPDSPAALAQPENASDLPPAALLHKGLQPGDTIVSINAKPMRKFEDIATAVMMAPRDEPLLFLVRRPGVDPLLRFNIAPRIDPDLKLLVVGVQPSRSARIHTPRTPEQHKEIQALLAAYNFPDLKPGMSLVAVADQPASSASDLINAFRHCDGIPIKASFAASPKNTPVEVLIQPRPAFQELRLSTASDQRRVVEHFLGLMPPIAVRSIVLPPKTPKAPILPGDVFSQIGPVRFPSFHDGTAAIQSAKGSSIPLQVLRLSAATDSAPAFLPVNLPPAAIPRDDPTIGFNIADAALLGSWIASWPLGDIPPNQSHLLPFKNAFLPGTRILTLNDRPVADFADLARILVGIAKAPDSPAASPIVDLHFLVELPPSPSQLADPTFAPTREPVLISLPRSQLQPLANLTWEPDFPIELFAPAQTTLKEDNPLDALRAGVRETHSVMLSTYLTFLRLFQGSVKVEHLKGPVGIAHVGTLIADRGFIWLLFYMGLISINLAVVNFLPIPITDGGQFLFLIYEAVTRKPPPVVVQNAAFFIAAALLLSIFLLVTYNDILNLLR